MPKPLVSIITINYNQARITCEMLASLQRITYPNVEVIVVDNASPTEDPIPIAEQFPDVQLIRSRENLGFAGGNNLGIRVARGKYALFLNNDTEVEPGFLEPLVELLETKPEIGLTSPKIIYYGTDHIVQYAGCEGINPWTGRGKVIGYMEKDTGQYNRSFPTKLVHGAAMIAPMSAIQKAGLMPEIYFLYYEEHDWCEMIKRAGYQCYFEADSTIYHKESISVGKGSLLKTYYMYRNRLLFIRRNSRGWQYWSGLLFFLFVAVPKNSLVFAMNREWGHFKALWRGLRWHLHGHDVHHNDFLLA
jgi:GT2 family glycosyltransferase